MPADDGDLRGVEPLAYVSHGDDRGNSTGVVLVHGAGGSAAGSWGPVAGRLAQHCRVIAPDNPGSGGTPLDGALTLDSVADRVARTAREAGLGRFAVVGLSMGAPISLRLATRHPGLVTGIGLIAGFAYPDARTRLTLGLWRSLLQADPKTLGQFLLSMSFGAEYLDQLRPAERDALTAELPGSLPPGVEAHIDLAERVDTRDDLGRIAVPAVVIGATDDTLIPVRHSEAIARGIPESRLARVPAGHSVPVERPEELLALLQPLLLLT
ncbi:MAG: alpha/beta hydrolase [Streptosporangiales bacterium]|nr:alpha/beta hydrolase [Streptosporangiales bacterium]